MFAIGSAVRTTHGRTVTLIPVLELNHFIVSRSVGRGSVHVVNSALL